MVRNEQKPPEFKRSGSSSRVSRRLATRTSRAECIELRPSAFLSSTDRPSAILFQRRSPIVDSTVSPSVGSQSRGVVSVLRLVASEFCRVASRSPKSSSAPPKSVLWGALRKAKLAAVGRVLQRARRRLDSLSTTVRPPAAPKEDWPRFAYSPKSVEGSATSHRAGTQSRSARVLN